MYVGKKSIMNPVGRVRLCSASIENTHFGNFAEQIIGSMPSGSLLGIFTNGTLQVHSAQGRLTAVDSRTQ